MMHDFEFQYAVNERFHTFQGEGVHMGRAAFFIRLHGCPVHCAWCDSASTWHPNYTPATVDRLSVNTLVEEAARSCAPLTVITGGEPCVRDLNPLVAGLYSIRSMAVAVETCGAFRLPDNEDVHVTVSPKRAALPLADSLRRARELKIIMETPESFVEWELVLGGILLGDANAEPDARWKAFHDYLAGRNPVVWLHPQWSERENVNVLDAITSIVKRNPAHCRAGWQLHKLYRADALDKRSRIAVPLGGDPKLGY